MGIKRRRSVFVYSAVLQMLILVSKISDRREMITQ